MKVLGRIWMAGLFALSLISTAHSVSAQQPPMECFFFRGSNAPSEGSLNLATIKPGALYAQATVDTSSIARGSWSEGRSSGSFKGQYSAQPTQINFSGSGAFGPMDDLKIFRFVGAVNAIAKSLPPSPIPTREVVASKFTYGSFVGYCVGTESEATLIDDISPVSCVFYAKPDVSGFFTGSIDGTGAGKLSGEVCLAGNGCLQYARYRMVEISDQTLTIILPDGSDTITYQLRETMPGTSGSVARAVKFYRSARSAPLPDRISCTVWSNDAVLSDPATGSGNGAQSPPPAIGGGRFGMPGRPRP